MTVLFDPTDDFVASVLDRAKREGEISLPDLEAICEAGLDARRSRSMNDILDTIRALADMRIAIDNGLTEEQEEHEDAEFLQDMRDFDRQGPTYQLTGYGWMRLLRAIEREKAPPHPRAAEIAAETRAIMGKRSFLQHLFAELGPRILRERRGPMVMSRRRQVYDDLGSGAMGGAKDH